MADLKLNAKVREEIGRAEAKSLRRNGEIPAIIYGKKHPPLSLKLNNVEIQKSRKFGFHENALVKILIDDKKKTQTRTVLIKEIQSHAITGQLLHIDFNEIALDEEIHAHVTTVPEGEPKGVKEQGGVLEHILHEVEVVCLPADIPETIIIDVSFLMIGDSVHVKDLSVGDKVKVLNDPELTVLAVAAPRVEEEPEPEPTEEEEAAEPELVDQKGKKDEDKEGAEEEAKEETKEEKK